MGVLARPRASAPSRAPRTRSTSACSTRSGIEAAGRAHPDLTEFPDGRRLPRARRRVRRAVRGAALRSSEVGIATLNDAQLGATDPAPRAARISARGRGPRPAALARRLRRGWRARSVGAGPAALGGSARTPSAAAQRIPDRSRLLRAERLLDQRQQRPHRLDPHAHLREVALALRARARGPARSTATLRIETVASVTTCSTRTRLSSSSSAARISSSVGGRRSGRPVGSCALIRSPPGRRSPRVSRTVAA